LSTITSRAYGGTIELAQTGTSNKTIFCKYNQGRINDDHKLYGHGIVGLSSSATITHLRFAVGFGATFQEGNFASGTATVYRIPI
jgi:hypothetical protein